MIEDPEKRTQRLLREGFESEAEYNTALQYHRSRIFDPESYYYYRIDRYPRNLPLSPQVILNNQEINRLVNNAYMYAEIERTKQVVEEDEYIKPYVKTKEAIEDNKTIMDNIVVGKRDTTLRNFLGQF